MGKMKLSFAMCVLFTSYYAGFNKLSWWGQRKYKLKTICCIKTLDLIARISPNSLYVFLDCSLLNQEAKERQQQQRAAAAEARNLTPPQTAAEATRQMLAKKRLDSKINYAVLDNLFEESVKF